MNDITLHNQSDAAYTQISNTFIDEYMPSANGSYVKVYLILLRTLSGNTFNITIANIADALELTENDVRRAFMYWEKHGLLYIQKNEKGMITDISLNAPAKNSNPANYNVIINNQYLNNAASDAAASSKISSDTAAENTDADAFSRPSYSAAEIQAISSQSDFAWIITIIEKYMEHTLSPSDVELVMFIYDRLKFSPDLILYLYEYCISKGKKNSKYIQAVAVNWADEGVDTVDKASQHTASFEARYIDIMKTFGLNNIPAPAQKKYIDTWLSYGLDLDVIKEACSRTLIAINEPSFKYASTILDNWNKQKVKTLDDVKKSDEIRAAKASAKTENTYHSSKKKNSFNSYEQRGYTKDDYTSIEQRLLSK